MKEKCICQNQKWNVLGRELIFNGFSDDPVIELLFSGEGQLQVDIMGIRGFFVKIKYCPFCGKELKKEK